MRILVTGATGFLGSHIVESFLDHSIEIVILKRKTSDIWRLKGLMDRLKSYNLDESKIDEVFKAEKHFDVVVHCATDYGRHGKENYSIVNSNITFPVELFETAILNNTECFINTDSFFSKSFEINQFLSGKKYLQAYTLSKQHFYDWARLLTLRNRIKFVNMRLEHIYGGKDSTSKFVPTIISKCLNREHAIDLTDGEQERDFIYIDDVVSAYMTVIRKLEGFEYYKWYEFEVGKGYAIRVREFVKLIKRLTNSETILNFGAITSREVEIGSSFAHNNKSLLNLGWTPRFDDETGIQEYIAKEYNKR